MGMKRIVLIVAAGNLMCVAAAHAATFCDLLPASELATALHSANAIVATPTADGGNGCDYKTAMDGPHIGSANTTNYSGMMKTIVDTVRASPGVGSELVPGIGEWAVYRGQSATFPNSSQKEYFQQSISFIAKGKYVTLRLTMPGRAGVPK